MKPASKYGKPDTKQLLIQTTLHLIETRGIEQVTVRKIAAQAGVNVAAVNYHFGSKDRIIFAALQTLRDGFGEAFKFLQSTELAPHERLAAFMAAYCDTIFSYPNLAKAFVTHSLHAEMEQEYAAFVRTEGLALITRTLGEFLHMDDETLRMKAFQMMSSLTLILLVGQETGAAIGLDFTDSGFRSRYIQTVVQSM
jgi:AcrR family transcriptional regulator